MKLNHSVVARMYIGLRQHATKQTQLVERELSGQDPKLEQGEAPAMDHTH
jgi:hypothetical protein